MPYQQRDRIARYCLSGASRRRQMTAEIDVNGSGDFVRADIIHPKQFLRKGEDVDHLCIQDRKNAIAGTNHLRNESIISAVMIFLPEQMCIKLSIARKTSSSSSSCMKPMW